MREEQIFSSQQDAILTFMSALGNRGQFGSVQLQKIPFLIQKEAGDRIVELNELFKFRPFNYGPVDDSIYQTLKVCENENLIISISPNDVKKHWRYQLTDEGYEIGIEKLNGMPDDIRKYIVELVNWVYNSSFKNLISAVYSNFPEMQVNSLFLKP